MYHRACILTLTGIGFCIGCGGEPGLKGLISATGTVTYQGKPVEGAQVVLSPETSGGRAAAGQTDAEGRFRLNSLKQNDGVMPGTYQVMISKRKVVGSMTADEAREWFRTNAGPPPGKPIKNSLPEKYGNVEESELTVEVTVGGENDFTFDLE